MKAFGVENKFGIHLVHGHLQVEAGKIMLGRVMSSFKGCWTRPTSISGLDLNNLHGHIFTLGYDGHFIPYEFREGAAPQMSAVDKGFVTALQAYLSAFNLTNYLGLEVLTSDSSKDMCELVLSSNFGTVMMERNLAKNVCSARVTGWSVNGIGELSGGQVHAKKTDDKHRVFVDSKLGPESVDEETVLDALRRVEIIE